MTNNDFSHTETFEANDVAAAIRGTLATGGCMAVLAGLIGWLLFASLLNAAGAPAPQLLGLLVTIAVVGGMVWAKVEQVKKQMVDTKIVVDPTGIAQHDGKNVVRYLAWADIERADMVEPVLQMQKVHGTTAQFKAVAGAAGGAAAAVGRSIGASIGFVGPGQYDFGPTGKMIQSNYLRTFGTTPEGTPIVGITPNFAGLNWSQERLGEWLTHYRPDVMEQVRALELEHKIN